MTEDTNGRRVTNRELNDKLTIVREEQKVEHLKTRLTVAAMVLGPGLLRELPTILGFIGLN